MSLHQLVTATAARTPGRPAVFWPGGMLTYGELDAQANVLARVLSARGVSHGDRVVIWSGNSAAAVVAMQAALRLGAAYVPASGMTPVGRVALMARDCAARAVCATPEALAQISARLGPGIASLSLDERLGLGPAEVPAASLAVAPDDLAYILYTSGSTGMPKGVCISHRAARAFVDWAGAEFGARPGDRFASNASFAFDLSVLDLYAPFAVGAAVCLAPAEAAYLPEHLVRYLYEQEISVWYSVPSVLIGMIRDGGLLGQAAPSSLRVVAFAGEPFPVGYVRRLAGWTRARLVNLYGPTETNVCTYHEVTAADLDRDRPVPIGIPSSGDRVWARTPDDGIASPGEEGELVVDGPTVMRGYWGREPQQGPYVTGDMVRVLPDGSFDFLGRRDHMVKVRGHRLELGEVEAVLGSHPDVAEIAVVTTGDGADCRLVAHVACRAGTSPGIVALRRHGAERLPPYMIPDEIRFVTGIPRTPNGKIDRAALESAAPKPIVKEGVT